jgi:rhodanese-related sulfurtransferase
MDCPQRWILAFARMTIFARLSGYVMLKLNMIKMVVVLAVIAVFLALSACGGTAVEPLTYKNVSPTEAATLIENNAGNMDFVILDVRTPGEYVTGHIENSFNIDFEAAAFRDDVKALDTDKTYLVYCRSGRRSAEASAAMIELGFTDVTNMTGGISEWQAAGLPVVK